MKKLQQTKLVEITGGKNSSVECIYTTDGVRVATVALLSSAFLAPLAAATGIGCAMGIAAGCAS